MIFLHLHFRLWREGARASLIQGNPWLGGTRSTPRESQVRKCKIRLDWVSPRVTHSFYWPGSMCNTLQDTTTARSNVTCQHLDQLV